MSRFSPVIWLLLMIELLGFGPTAPINPVGQLFFRFLISDPEWNSNQMSKGLSRDRFTKDDKPSPVFTVPF